ncbi:MAG TPA: efflux RND transporter periplasmic adaptor subunit [Oscillatoriaceae cyanobacterium]
MPPRSSVLPLVTTVLLLAGCHKTPPKAASVQPVLTVTAEPATAHAMTHRLELTGSVAAWQLLPVSPQTAGLRVVSVLVDEGSHVKRGQVMAKLDDATLQAELAQARARVEDAKANLASALDAYTRYAELEKQGGVSASEMTTRRIAVDTARASLAESEAALQQSQVAVSQTQVTAPDNGLVIKRNVQLGDVAAIANPMFTLARDNRLEVDAPIAESDLANVHAGQAAHVSSDAMPGLSAVGRVREVTPALDATNRQATAKIDLPASSGFKIGMFVRATLNTGTSSAIAVPLDSVITTQGGSQVFVLSGNVVHARPVTTGEQQDTWIAITSGLQPGDDVVTSGAGFLKDGDTVTVVAATPAADASATASGTATGSGQ